MNKGITQHQRFLACLRNPDNQEPGGWVSLPRILALEIAQYGRVINDLREGKVKALGKKKYDIENTGEWIGGKHRTWFRLVEPIHYSSQAKMAFIQRG